MASREIFVDIVLFIPQGVWDGKSIDLFVSGLCVVCTLKSFTRYCCLLCLVLLIAGGMDGWLVGGRMDGDGGEIGDGE